MSPTERDIPALKRRARRIRRDIVEMLAAAGTGHPGGSLSAADIVTCLYFTVMRHRPEAPGWPDREQGTLLRRGDRGGEPGLGRGGPRGRGLHPLRLELRVVPRLQGVRAYSFGTLWLAQALGDFASLEATGRRVVRIHLAAPTAAAVGQASSLIQAALPAGA